MLEGKHINIRSLEDYDLTTIFEWSLKSQQYSFFLDNKNDVDIKSFIQLKKDSREKRSQALIPHLPLVIEETNGNIIGFCLSTVYPSDNLTAALHIAFLQEDYFFDHLGKEAGNLMLEYFFNKKNLFRVFTKVLEEEKICLDYLTRLGFKLEGVQRDQIFLKGSYRNLYTLGILKEETEWVLPNHE